MKLADRYEEQKYQDQYSVSNVNYSFFAETRILFCHSKNINGGWYQIKKEIVRWDVFRLMSGEKNWLCFGLSLKELSQFVTNT